MVDRLVAAGHQVRVLGRPAEARERLTAAGVHVAAMFTASPRVAVDEQAGAGHNLSLGLTAMAYHLKVLSFVEECAVDHANASPIRDDAARRPGEMT